MNDERPSRRSCEELEAELAELRHILDGLRGSESAAVPGGDSGSLDSTRVQNQRLIEENARLIRRLEEHARMKSEFLANVSHEIRTPLAAAREFLNLSLDIDLPADARQCLLMAARNLTRIGGIIDDLLDLSRIEAGQPVALRPAVTSPQEIIAAALSSVQPLADDRGVQIRTDLSQAGAIFGDTQRLVQVVIHLLTNAIKWSQRGETVTVSAESELETGHVRFTVADRGPGIPVEEQTRIFERFYQIARPDQVGGAGLGLAVAREIVRAHRGDLGVASRPGEGSSFWFTVPLSNNEGAHALLVVENAARTWEGPIAVVLVNLTWSSPRTTAEAALRATVPASACVIPVSPRTAVAVLHAPPAPARSLTDLWEALANQLKDEPAEAELITCPGDVASPGELVARLARRLPGRREKSHV
jgi:signal transduction histidine kinase